MKPPVDAELCLALRLRGRRLREALESVGGRPGLQVASLDELVAAGVSRLHAETFIAVRQVLAAAERPEQVRSASDIWKLVRADLGHSSVERMAVVLLDGLHRVVHQEVVSVGSTRFTIVDPVTIFRLALVYRATAVVVAHNHPSGDPRPSATDLTVTETLERAGRAIGIPLLDHLVVTRQEYTSIAREMGGLGASYQPCVVQSA